jgi:chromosome segregation ATPase
MSDHDDNHQQQQLTPRGGQNNNNALLSDSQRKVFIARELDRMKHVINRLHIQESRNAKRAQIAELKAREVEVVRHESERDARIRQELAIEERDRQARQHERVKALRNDRKERAESSKKDVRTKKMEAARVTKEQHKFINLTLTESNAEHHDRCVAQHNIIRQSEKQGTHSARAKTVEKKREAITMQSQKTKDELSRKEQELQSLIEKAEALKRKVDESKSVESAANNRLQQLCGSTTTASGGNSPALRNNNNSSRNNNSGGGTINQQSNNNATGSSRGGATTDQDGEL